MVDRSENRLHVTTDQLKEQAKYQIILTCRSLEKCDGKFHPNFICFQLSKYRQTGSRCCTDMKIALIIKLQTKFQIVPQ